MSKSWAAKSCPRESPFSESDNITINVSIQIRYGGIIPEIAKKVQEAIISSVEDTSGLKVAAVNVRVGGVTFEKPED